MAPNALSVVLAGASIAALYSQPTLRETLVATLIRWTGYGVPGGVWRIAAILLALANLKNLPFVWHVRPNSRPLSQASSLHHTLHIR